MTKKAKEMTNALVLVPPPPPPPARRIVGQAIQTNPLIGAVAQITPEGLVDIQEEIRVTENYLAGLRAMHHVGSMALGLTATPEVTVHPPEPDPKPEPPVKVETPKPKATKQPTGKPRGRPGVSGKIREWLTAEPALSNEVIIQRLKDAGINKEDHAVRALAYNVRSMLKKETGAATPETPKVQATANDGALRKQVAEYVFKKGLLSADEISKQFNVDVIRVNSLVQNHPWFEAHMGKWRLTYAGKNEAIDY